MRVKTDSPLIEAAKITAARFAIEPEMATWIARKLGAADMIDLDEPTPRNLARLLVAVMGSSRPADAPQIVRSYEAAQLDCVATFDAEGRPVCLRAAQLAAIPALELLAGFVGRDPVTVLADLIAMTAEMNWPAPVIDAGKLEIDRNPETPMLRLWAKDRATASHAVFVWRGRAAAKPGLQVFAITSGDVLADLAPFAAGWFAPLLESAHQLGA